MKKLKSGELVKVTQKNKKVEIITSLDQTSLIENTRNKFDINEQIAALFEQVELISQELKINLTSRFKEQLDERSKILDQHKQNKNTRKKEFGI